MPPCPPLWQGLSGSENTGDQVQRQWRREASGIKGSGNTEKAREGGQPRLLKVGCWKTDGKRV